MLYLGAHTNRLMAVLIFSLLVPNANAGVREQAKRMHDRLAGVPPSETVLLDMAADLSAGDYTRAANTAMDNPGFLNVTLQSWVTPWTNRDEDVFQPLNDYTATVIGLVRDRQDFRQLLFADVLYTADDALGFPRYSNSDNAHYEALQASGVSLADALVARTQSAETGLDSDATAGVMTTRAAAQSFFIDGTNRAMFRFTLKNHLCHDLEQVQDTSRAPDRIRQDVSRSPGGDSRVFLNNCIACHSGMDPMAQAFAYYDFTYATDAEAGQLDYNSQGELDTQSGSRVKNKYHINSANFPYGYVTPDDQWDNYWREGNNQSLGWSSALPGRGAGAKSMGQELAYSDAFAQCQVEKVFRLVCLREPGDASDRAQVSSAKAVFQQADAYDLKRVFAETANYCKGS